MTKLKLEELLKLEKTLNNETEWQWHMAKTLVKNNQFIQAVEKKREKLGGKNSFMSFTKDDFTKDVKMDPNNPYIFMTMTGVVNASLNRDPKSGLWGFYAKNRGFVNENGNFFYVSPNLDHDRENREAKAFLKSQGIKIGSEDFVINDAKWKSMNKQSDSVYSLKWCMAFLEIIARNWNCSGDVVVEMENEKSWLNGMNLIYETTEQEEKTKIQAQIAQLRAELEGNTTPVETKPIESSKPIESPKPTTPSDSTSSESKPITLPTTGLTQEQRDKLANYPFLEQENKDLKQDKLDIKKMLGDEIATLNSDLIDKGTIIEELQNDLSGVKAERDNLRPKEKELNNWKSTFPHQEPSEVLKKVNQPKLDATQQEAVNNYSQVKTSLAEWDKAFPKSEFPTAESARTAYDQAIKNQKPVDHDKISDDLREWQTAFPPYKYPGKPEDLRKRLDRAEANQTPSDYEPIKSELADWKQNFSGSEFAEKTPSQVRQVFDEQKAGLSKSNGELLSQYKRGASRRIDNILIRLKKQVAKTEIEKKYGGKKIDMMIEDQLTLDNREECERHLNMVLNICAAEKAEAWSKQVNELAKTDVDRPTKVNELVEFLGKVATYWTQITPNSQNPFYVPIIEQQEDYRKKVTTLRSEWGKQATSTRALDWAREDRQATETITTTYTANIEYISQK